MDRNQRENDTTQRLEKDGRPKIESLLRKTQTILKNWKTSSHFGSYGIILKSNFNSVVSYSKGDLKRDDSQRRFLVQHSFAML